MRILLLTVALIYAAVAGATAAGATLAGAAEPPAKGTDHVGERPAIDGRQGGETIDDAVLIPDLPFSDSGATCDNIDDYDEICPYSGSTSPDVVYRYVPLSDDALTIDLCGSTYDTKLYVYDENLELVACNDDYYFDDFCGIYVSYLENVQIFAGMTYYIVIDGYGGDCGVYELNVYGGWWFPVHCPDEHIDEGEPDPHDGYVDTYNASCELAVPYAADFGEDCLTMCARGGMYTTDSELLYDRDWFVCQPLGESITVTADTETPIILEFYTGADCDALQLVWTQEVYPWEDPTFDVDTDWAPLVYVLATTEEWPWANPYDYALEICGIDLAPVATTAQSWSAVKAIYR